LRFLTPILFVLASAMIGYALWPEDLFISATPTDFGQQNQDQILKFNIRIRNNTFAKCEIVRVETSCSCTSTGETAFSLASFSNRSVEMTWDLHGREGNNTTDVTVYYQFGTQPIQRQTVRVATSVTPDIAYSAKQITLTDRSREAAIEFTKNRACEIESVSVLDNRLETQIDHQNNKILVRVKEGVRLADSSGLGSVDSANVIVRSTCPGEPIRLIGILFK
jgi:hypothetical protein